MTQVAGTPVPPALPGIPFDPNWLINQLVPLVVLVVVIVGLRWLLRSPVGEALADRIRGRAAGRAKGQDATLDAERVAALEAAVSQLHGQVAELGERLDFAERLLADRRERQVGAGQ